MKYLIITAFLLINLSLAGQDYVITNNGDTLRGEIKPPLFEYLEYQRVVFKSDERKVYFPEDLRGYTFGNGTYETHDVGKKGSNKIFLKAVVRGYCTLYEYQYVTTLSVTGGAMSSQPMFTYYLKRPDEDYHVFSFSALKSGKDLYFLDNGPLTFDLHQGKYKKSGMKEIVERYNKEKK